MADGNIGMTAIKPPGWDRKGMEACKYFLYNPETGEFLSRTPLSWLKITVFYTIYYTLLGCFWIGCLNIFFLTLPESHPKWMLDASIIGSNPGLGLRPASRDKLIDSSMIVLNIGDTNTVPTNEDGEGDRNIDYAVRASKYMKMYENIEGLENCDSNTIRKEDQPGCIFNLKSALGSCSEYPYGYTVEGAQMDGQSGYNPGGSKFAEPCLFLKLNKIFDWQPKPITCKGELKDDCENKLKKFTKMSPHLKKKIIKENKEGGDPNYVWVDCFGRYAADQESLNVEYLPYNQGFPLKYFPFRGGNYHTPLVAVKLKIGQSSTCSPPSSPPYYDAANCGQLIQVECRAYFEGVIHDTKDKAGLVQFEVHILPNGTNHVMEPPRVKADAMEDVSGGVIEEASGEAEDKVSSEEDGGLW